MTYKDFINRVNNKIRFSNDWPGIDNLTQEQVDLSYLAALSVASEISISSFKDSQFTATLLTNERALKNISQYQLPETLFRYRQDLGITSVEVNGYPYQLDEAQPLTTLRRLSLNPYYKDETYFSVNIADRRFYSFQGCEIVINHLKEFEKPALLSIKEDPSPEYPLEGTHSERAASIVATHVQGEKSRDTAAAQFQALLQRQYTTAPTPALQSTEAEQ
jgi:hypothetical protein